MKKIMFLVITIFVSFFMVSKVNALSGYTTNTYVGYREGPGTNYKRLGQVNEKNTVLDLVSDELYNKEDKDCSGGWYKIRINNAEVYMCGLYVSIGEVTGGGDVSYNTDTFEARINGVNIKVMKTNSYNSSLITTLLPGTNVTIIGDKISGSGCSEGFYKIKYNKNSMGYVCSKFVLKKSEMVDTDVEYTKYLSELGFPESYIPYLTKLHKLHPTWTFKPIITNLHWSEVVNGVTSKTNLINYANDLYRVDQDDSVDGSGWYRAKPEVTAFYLDPRNFLSEKFVFMFESLKYNYGSDNKDTLNKDSEITKKYYNTISSVFSGSFLNTDEYKYMFIGAGFTHNVSPVHLATRAHGEGATNEEYVAVSGTYSELYNGLNLKGYYNFYNIKAFKTAGWPNPVLNGLKYACGSKCGGDEHYYKPWDTREKAIYGGAQIIAEGYIADGQHTQYLQRFNVDPAYNTSATLYTHSYQTNVLAPASEGADAYIAYKEMKLLDEPFLFDIPVFLNMPEVVSLPTNVSKINTIESISINGKNVSNFDKDILEFNVYVNKSDKEYNLNVVLSDSSSKVEGTGKLDLPSDKTIHEIKVTSENGDVRIYKLTIIKVSDTTSISDIISNLSVKVSGSVIYNISPNTNAGTLINSINKYSAGTTVTINESNGVGVGSGSTLKTGQTIKMITPSGESKSFVISIIGDVSGDGEVTILDLLKVQKHLLGSSKLSSEYLISGDTNGDAEVTILDLLRVQKYILKSITF